MRKIGLFTLSAIFAGFLASGCSSPNPNPNAIQTTTQTENLYIDKEFSIYVTADGEFYDERFISIVKKIEKTIDNRLAYKDDGFKTKVFLSGNNKTDPKNIEGVEVFYQKTEENKEKIMKFFIPIEIEHISHNVYKVNFVSPNQVSLKTKKKAADSDVAFSVSDDVLIANVSAVFDE